MQKMIGVMTAVALVAAAMPASAESSLYERNYNLLLSLLPEGAVIEVQMIENGEMVTQIWTAEQFADFRANFAVSIGKDYTAGAEGAPGGAGNFQSIGDTWVDAWGPNIAANVAVPRGLPTTVPIDDKLWLYGGAGSQTGIYEHPGGCVHLFSFFTICSSVYGWTYPQSGANVGATWAAGTGLVFNFGAPFGGLAYLDGVVLAE